MMRDTVYVVDDEALVRDGIRLALEETYRVRAFAAAEPALAAADTTPPDLVLLDIGLPGMDGLTALDDFRKQAPQALVVMITGIEDIDTVVTAMKHGAHDYIVKPLQMETLEQTIANALETTRLRKEVRALQARYLQENVAGFVGESDRIQSVMDFVARVARSPDTPVLILGQTGTGKELIASAIHHQSPNFRGPFAAVNCAAIPTELIESELFGYARGAFSGAATDKPGRIEAATDGTLFLDEIGDLSEAAQAKLLRFIESGEFFRVGGTRCRRAVCRIVSATNKDLEAMMAAGRFRRDLYFRLGVIRLTVPSLDERRDDIRPLAHFFIEAFNRKFDKAVRGLTPEAGLWLEARRWRGNVRELRNAIEQAVLLAEGDELTPADLDPSAGAAPAPEKAPASAPRLTPAGIDLTAEMAAIERAYLLRALELAQGNESRAARLLGLNHHTFRYRRRKLAVDKP